MYILILLFYIVSNSNTLYSGDSGDLLAAILNKGFPHPPGYSLYTFLGVISQFIPLSFLSPAGKVAFLSSISTLVGLFFFSRIIKEVTPPKYYNRYLLWISVLSVAANYLIWLYAVTPEVFPLNTAITFAILYFAIKAYKLGHIKYLYILCFLIGIGITHHYSFVLVLPSVFYLIYRKRRSFSPTRVAIIKGIASFFIGLTPLLYLIWSYDSASTYIWARLTNVWELIALITRSSYGTFIASPVILNTPQDRLNQIKHLFVFLNQDFKLIGIILALLGALFIYKKRALFDRHIIVSITLSFILFGPFFFFYANFPLISNYFLATSERFLHVFYFLFGVLIYFGMLFYTEFISKPIIRKYLKNVMLAKFATFLMVIIISLYPLSLFARSYLPIFGLKNSKIAENVGVDLLSNIPRNSIIFLTTDVVFFNTLYVYNTRPDLAEGKIIVHDAQFYTNYYFDRLKLKHPQIQIPKGNKDLLSKFITLNKKNHTIFSEDIYNYSSDSAWIYNGLVYKLTKPDKSEDDVKALDQFWKNSQDKYLSTNLNQPVFGNFFISEVLSIYAIAHQTSARFYLSRDMLDSAKNHIKSATILNPKDARIESENLALLAVYQARLKNCHGAETNMINAYKLKKDKKYLEFILNLGDMCYKDAKNKKRIGKMIDTVKQSSLRPLKEF